MAGYVYQDDVILETMTVREAIMMAAHLRLPQAKPLEKEQKVDDLIELLGLSKARHTVIGSSLKPGISGGERKRTAIAMQMVENKPILVLDECTSGLDSFTAHSVIEMLSRLAREHGQTVIATVHQPSSDIFHMFDDLCLMHEGQVVYWDEGARVVEYFDRLGFKCPLYSNPSDFLFMSVLNQSTLQKISTGPSSTAPVFDDNESRTSFLVKSWLEYKLDQVQQRQQRVDSVVSLDEQDRILLRTDMKSTSASFLTQFTYLFGRAFRNFYRNALLLRVKFFQAIFIGLLLGSIYFHIDAEDIKQRQMDVAGACFFLTVNVVFMFAFGVLNVFAGEKQVFYREYRNGYYTLPAYFLSKTLVELPFLILYPIIQSSLAYWLVFGVEGTVSKFAVFSVICIMLANVGQALGIFAASAFNDLNIATVILPLTLLPAMIFSGLFINTASIPSYYVWLKWISPMKYGFSAFVKNHYTNWEWTKPHDYPDPMFPPRLTGDDEVKRLGLDDGMSVQTNLVALLGMYTGLMLLAYFCLWRSVKRST